MFWFSLLCDFYKEKIELSIITELTKAFEIVKLYNPKILGNGAKSLFFK